MTGSENLLTKKSGVPARAVYLSAVGLSQLVILLSLPIVTRNVGPTEVGAWQYWVTLLGVSSSIANLRYDILIHSTRALPDQLRLLKQGVAISVAGGTLISLLVSSLLQGDLASPWGVLLLTCATVSTSIFSLFNAVALSNQRHGRAAGGSFAQGLFTGGLQAGAAMASSLRGLLLAAAVAFGRFAGAVTISVRLIPIRNLGPIRLASSVRGAPWATVGSTLLSQAILDAPLLVLGRGMDEEAFGYAALAWRVAVLPMSLIGVALAQLITADVGRAAHTVNGAGSTFRIWFVRLSVVSVISVVLFAGFATLGVEFAFGEGWGPMGEYLLAWSPVLASQILASPLSQVLPVLNRRTLHLLVDLARGTLLLSSFLLVILSDAGPVHAVWLVSGAIALGYAVQVIAGVTAFRRPRRCA